MEKRVLRLGVGCTDKATGLRGTLTHWVMNMEGNVEYVFQPKGLNPPIPRGSAAGSPLRKA